MSERKETGLRIAPAPWTWEEHELSEGYSCIVYDANGHRIGTDHLSQGDAALIAAAPALHEALSAMIAFWDNGRTHGFMGMDGYQALDRAARSALLLANKGGTENG